jgi:hypothetical protein
VDKYHIGAVGHLCKHYERAKDADGNYIRFKNQNIDLSMTAGNYNLAVFQSLPQIEFIRKRLSEVKVFKRADVKVMCDWVVTLPKGMETDERRFFEETVKFLSDRYGRQNVISAYVHRDETQPHIHFAFIPVAVDKKKGIEKVSAKEVLTRTELQRFHSDLDNYLSSVFGRSTGILNGATVEGNRSIDELKRGTAVKALKEVRAARETEEKRIAELRCPPQIEPVKVKGDVAVISLTDLESVNNGLAKIQLSGRHRQDADERAAAVGLEKQRNYGKLWREYDKLKAEVTSLEARNRQLNNALARYDRVFNVHSGLLESFLQFELQMNQAEAEAERAAQALKRKLRQLEKGELQM